MMLAHRKQAVNVRDEEMGVGGGQDLGKGWLQRGQGSLGHEAVSTLHLGGE